MQGLERHCPGVMFMFMFMLLGMDANLCHILTNSLANQIVEFNFSVPRAEANIFNELHS